MKKIICAWAVIPFLCFSGTALGQTLEVALTCEDARTKLGELAAIPETDLEDVAGISKAIGTAVLMSCDVPSGKVVCYQCIGKDRTLRSIEAVHDLKSGKLHIKGYGCSCKDRK
ncbi:MAG: hypothetical protein RDU20_16810 [Desulfomonilaceae bacterium]|nr:hypothetical protein [Desulfomonilaceae bacterium]